jgi:hypothetical protein
MSQANGNPLPLAFASSLGQVRRQNDQNEREVQELRSQLAAATVEVKVYQDKLAAALTPNETTESKGGGSTAIRFEIQAEILYKTAFDLELLRDTHRQVQPFI